MFIFPLEGPAKLFFDNALKFEELCPQGEWRYFNFIEKNRVQGLFQTEDCPAELEIYDFLKPHEDFFSFFLGLYKPELSESLDVLQFETFSDFCLGLNQALGENKKIFDLSKNKFWIWTEDRASNLTIPSRLKDYLS